MWQEIFFLLHLKCNSRYAYRTGTGPGPSGTLSAYDVLSAYSAPSAYGTLSHAKGVWGLQNSYPDQRHMILCNLCNYHKRTVCNTSDSRDTIYRGDCLERIAQYILRSRMLMGRRIPKARRYQVEDEIRPCLYNHRSLTSYA